MSFDAAQAHARRKADDRLARVNERRAELLRFCSRFPATHQHWSAQRVAEFKDAAAKGRTAANHPTATELTLQAHINTLKQFYD